MIFATYVIVVSQFELFGAMLFLGLAIITFCMVSK